MSIFRFRFPVFGQKININFFVFQTIESRLKMSLPSELSSALSDGVVLCYLVNHVKPQSVASIHVPSSSVVKAFLFLNYIIHVIIIIPFIIFSLNLQWRGVEETLIIFWKHVVTLVFMRYLQQMYFYLCNITFYKLFSE